MTQETVSDDLALALTLADRADEVTLDRFGALDLAIETKPDLTPVSDADRAAEETLRALIAEARPDDAVVGEEYGTTGASPRRWILDPIDGTKNYVRGVPVWATLIALTVVGDDDAEPTIELGVVSAPALGRRWWARRGGGAWMSTFGRSQQINVSSVTRVDDASISFSEWNDPAWDVGTRRAAFDDLLRKAWRSRAYGDFWSHMMVAEGTVDIAVEPELNAWDMAALVPIVEEAGGSITALDGTPALRGGNALSTNGHLHQLVVDAFGTR